jgi:hypothetical protein
VLVERNISISLYIGPNSMGAGVPKVEASAKSRCDDSNLTDRYWRVSQSKSALGNQGVEIAIGTRREKMYISLNMGPNSKGVGVPGVEASAKSRCARGVFLICFPLLIYLLAEGRHV